LALMLLLHYCQHDVSLNITNSTKNFFAGKAEYELEKAKVL